MEHEHVDVIYDEAADAQRRKSMKRLSCRKCEGHGFHAILKGHAPVCPFNECKCETCSAVMSLRANALIRRFRHRKPDHSDALLKTIRSKNGNMRLRILPKTANMPQDHNATEVHYNHMDGRGVAVRSNSVQSGYSSVCSASSGTCSPTLTLTPSPIPPHNLPAPLPVTLPNELINEYLQSLLLQSLVNRMPTQLPNAPQLPLHNFMIPTAPSTDLLYAQSLLLSSLQQTPLTF